MTNFETLYTSSNALIHFRHEPNEVTSGDIVNVVWDVIEKFDLSDGLRDVANQVILALHDRFGLKRVA